MNSQIRGNSSELQPSEILSKNRIRVNFVSSWYYSVFIFESDC